MSGIRVVAADDHPLMLDAIVARLNLEHDIAIVATADSCAALLEATVQHQPDVALADVAMTDGSTLAWLAELRARAPQTRILLLTAHATGSEINAGMAAGAAGFLSKTLSPDDVPRFIRAVAAGETVLDAASADAVLEALRQASAKPALSAREHQMLQLVAAGLTNREIAGRVGLSVSTVKTNLERAFSKLEVSDRAAAVARAKDLGLF